MKIAGVYKIKNKINGKFYIGSSVDIKNRWSVHKMRLRKQIHANSILQNAWNYYGENNFSFEIIKIVEDKTQAVVEEQMYLDKLNPEYNIVKRAEATNLGRKFTKKQKENIRISKLGVYDGENNPFYGKKHSKETRKRISEKAKARRWPDEHKEHLAQMLMGEKSHYAKLTWEQVNEIRRLHEQENWTENMLIEKFCMSQSAINKILLYKTWRIK